MTSELLNGGPATPARKNRSRRRRKQKKNKAAAADASTGDESDASTVIDGGDNVERSDSAKASEAVEVEYVPDQADLDGVMDEEFRKVFEKFNFTKPVEEDVKKEEADADKIGKKKVESDDEEEEQDRKEKVGGVSNKQKKLQRRMKIAELKNICSRPDVVEVWDATAPDPKLLIHLKSYRNTVPVPRHWSQKRSYLQGKRGTDKKPYELPDYIAKTGITTLREAYVEKEDSKKLKQKQRDKMQGKKGKFDIDYEILHDAFFKHMKKPPLTSHGDLYYEGKEFEVKLKERKPGMLSQELKHALGMEEGVPPPWLVSMQRNGPPPSYPQLKIPGVNAPIPRGASFGFQPGGWGRPPVDHHGQPLYGDVFGLPPEEPNYAEAEDKTKHWGDFDPVEEEEEDEEDEVEVPDDEENLEDGIQSVDSLSSTPTDIETPDVFDLRKQQKKEPAKPLYKVLEQKEAKIAPGTLLGTSHTYALSDATQDKSAGKSVDLLRGQRSDRVEVSLNPEELEAMENVIPAKYEEAREEEKLRNKKEDFRDMVAENTKKRKRKMQEKDKKLNKKAFKF
ncbi:Splicing factor 3B subunit 2 [Heracleum sosnowskyi]|uniref:Splicing factor 3B subunit 2 n=1 Tax=Heracleum sosnowskyi TaxID=360622 RepID=A0AAD8IJ67_9APIA|nr:Splicing factor 3B subunit 2 [Heracleum sosnowskyi]KAK1385872.1 Splicing factor 3B subunit 2 [Heracleum sosnowskyi]